MARLTLVIGNKNYSSWSLRAWLLLKHVGVAFDEIVIALDQPDTREQLDRYGPSGRVPVLHDGEVRVWDSLAICEYVAELSGKGWPQERTASILQALWALDRTEDVAVLLGRLSLPANP